MSLLRLPLNCYNEDWFRHFLPLRMSFDVQFNRHSSRNQKDRRTNSNDPLDGAVITSRSTHSISSISILYVLLYSIYKGGKKEEAGPIKSHVVSAGKVPFFIYFSPRIKQENLKSFFLYFQILVYI
jgi:hypothetical protein